jgi:hypothetical protein
MPGAIEELLEQQKQIMRQLADLAVDTRLTAEWYTAADCARLKGISHATLTCNRWMRPMGGKGTRKIARRERWHRAAVREWLAQDDETLLSLYGKPADRERYAKGIAKSA